MFEFDVFSNQCLLGLYVTLNVVKLMFIAYFSLSVTMMVISVYVNVHLLYMLLFKSCL